MARTARPNICHVAYSAVPAGRTSLDRHGRPTSRVGASGRVPLSGTLVHVVADPGSSSGQTIAAVDRAIDVLDLFAESQEPTLGVTEIAQQLGISKAVVFRILSSFRAKGFVEMDERTHRYALGPKVLQLGLSHLARFDVRQKAHDVLEALSRETDETATLSVLAGDQRVYIDQVTPARDVRMVVELGRPQVLHAGASSKALLAFLPSEVQAEYLRGKLQRLTKTTITNAGALRKELDAIRTRGYAVSFGERLEGAGSVAAPVLGHDDQVVAVISVSGPVERFRAVSERAAKLLVKETSDLSRRLGYQSG